MTKIKTEDADLLIEKLTTPIPSDERQFYIIEALVLLLNDKKKKE